MTFDKTSAIKISAISGLISLLVYSKALTCGFVVLDDPLYVLNNQVIRTLDRNLFSSVFTHVYVNWWMPLTWISLAVDYHFWGLNPFGYHLTNMVLHAVNTGLVVMIADFLLKDKESMMPGKYLYSAALLLAGLLWGIHPLRVESVVWVAERKDVLNGLFALGSIYCYLRYVQLKDSGRAKLISILYLSALVLLILSLMAKSVSVVIPAVLLALDWYPLNRLHKGNYKSVLIEKIPFFVVSAAMSVATIYFIGEANYLISNDNFPFGQRLIVSGNALFEYCLLLLYPFGIVPVHLIPDPIPMVYSVKAVIAVVLLVLCIYTDKKKARSSVLLCFVLPLLPVLALFQNGDQAFASRFTYLPSVAPAIAAAFVFITASRKVVSVSRSKLLVLAGIIAVILVFYVVMTQRLITVWNDSETFWSRVVAIEPSAFVYKERALILVQLGKYDAAVEDLTAAIRAPANVWRPYIYNLYALRGETLRMAGRYNEAVTDFSTAIAMFPHPVYYRLRGVVLMQIGRTTEAEDDFRRAGGDVTSLAWYWSKIDSQK